MKNKIKEALKQGFPNLGLSEKAFDGVASFLETTVTEDAQIEGAVKSAETLLKAFQGEVDRERSSRSALQKELDDLKKKVEPKPQEPTPKKDEPQPKPNDEILKTIQALTDKITAMETEKARTSLLGSVEAMLTDKKVPKSYFTPLLQARSFGEQDTAEGIAKEIESQYEALEVEIAKERFGGITIPERSAPPVNDLDAFANAIKESNKEITK